MQSRTWRITITPVLLMLFVISECLATDKKTEQGQIVRPPKSQAVVNASDKSTTQTILASLAIAAVVGLGIAIWVMKVQDKGSNEPYPKGPEFPVQPQGR